MLRNSLKLAVELDVKLSFDKSKNCDINIKKGVFWYLYGLIKTISTYENLSKEETDTLINILKNTFLGKRKAYYFFGKEIQYFL